MKKLGFIAMTMLVICSLAVPLASARGEKKGIKKELNTLDEADFVRDVEKSAYH